MSDEIIVHPGPMSAYRDLFDQEILNLAPTPPTFDRSLDEIMAEVRSTIRKVTITRTLDKPHRLIAKVLNEDEKRKQKTNDLPMSFILDKPLFESPFERRRLRLLDSIFKALDNYGMRSWLDGKYARDVGAYINDQAISFKIDDKKADLSQGHVDYKPCLNPSGKMKIVIYGTYCETKPRRTWEDVEDGLIEKSITEIVIAVVEAGERQYRYSAQRSYEFILQRKAKLIEEARIKKEENERKEREHRIQLEQKRIERLLSHATELRQAQDIRAYVQGVKSLLNSDASTEFQEWERWALAQADRIDPVVSGRFKDIIK